MYKIKMFIKWMSERMTNGSFTLHDEFLTSSTGEHFIEFRQEDMKLLSNSRSSNTEPHTHDYICWAYQVKCNFRITNCPEQLQKGYTKSDASAYPIFKNDLYHDIFQRSFLAIIKAQGLYDVADPDYDPGDGDYYEQELFQEKQSFVYSVLVASLQTDKRRDFIKEFEGDARSILSKLHHYHAQSNVAQHEVVTLTTYITNLSLTDSWKGTTRQFHSHFKEKLRLLDSLVPDTDKIPETARSTFLQRAVKHSWTIFWVGVSGGSF